MGKTVVKVKGIVKKENEYLVLKHWYDDRIPEPYMWEFVDGNVEFGEKPDDAVCRLIAEYLGVEGCINRIAYTWSQVVGDTHILGIAYVCSAEDSEFMLTEDFGGYEWIKREEFEDYIENQYVLNDVKGVEL